MTSLLRRRSIHLSLVVAAATGTYVVASRSRSLSTRLTDLDTPAVPSTSNGRYKTDVLIVGSGGAALTAALRLKSAGLNPLIVEKADKIGGTTTYSGGGLWIPNTHLHAALPGHDDSYEEALEYLENVVGDAGLASTRERKQAFLQHGPEMIKFLESQGMKWIPTIGYPDYFPEKPGGKTSGRSVEPGVFDANQLGPWKDKLNYNPVRPPFPVHSYELSKMVRAGVSWEGKYAVAKAYGVRKWPQEYLLGESPVTLGVSLVGQLLNLNLRKGLSIWTNSPLKELILDDEEVTGAIIERDGQAITVEATHGVILAAGGFARNPEMRKKFQAPPISSDWTSVVPTDQGDAITAARKVGVATALMDSAWWGAAMVDPSTGTRFWCLYDRVLPHSIIVNQAGKRFTNESENYNSIGNALWRGHQISPTIPSHLIIDSQHRNRYVLAGKFMPGRTPQSAIDSGFLTQADSISALAGRIHVDPPTLEQTVQRFNVFAKQGKDDDFGRGKSAYDAFLGDPTYQPNANLGSIEKGPFYAIELWPGDLGTNGGVLTDENARALRETKSGEFKVVKGLYAVGNSSATVMGRTYAGAGATLGPALTFAYIAASQIAKESQTRSYT